MKPEIIALTGRLEQAHWWFAARRRILRALANAVAPPDPSTVVLDVGCGTGATVAELAGDYACVGVDLSEQSIAWARRQFPQVRFVLGPWQEGLAAAGGKADLVLLADVLEHVPEDAPFLAGLVQAAPPGAHLLLTVPANPALWSSHDVSHGHVRRYTREGFERLWRGLPVTPRLVSYFNARLYPLLWLARKLGRARAAASGSEAPDLRLPPAPVNRLLTAWFAGEQRVLLDQLRGVRRTGYAAGASLVAVLHRD